jgi:hypothetical protein
MFRRCGLPAPNSGPAGLESSEDLHGCDGGAGEFRRDIAADGGEAKNLNVERGVPPQANNPECFQDSTPIPGFHGARRRDFVFASFT